MLRRRPGFRLEAEQQARERGAGKCEAGDIERLMRRRRRVLDEKPGQHNAKNADRRR